MTQQKTTLTNKEEKILNYLSDGNEASAGEIAKTISSPEMSFLVGWGLVESFKSRNKNQNLLVTKYKITESGLKVLENIQNGITQEFKSTETAWQENRKLH